MANKNLINLSKNMLYQNKLCSQWLIEMLNFAIDDSEEKKKIYDNGITEANNYIKNYLSR